MNQQEFMKLNEVFDKAMEARCKEEGITFKVIQHHQTPMGIQTVYLLNNEVYTLQNNGDLADWQFSGFMQEQQS